MLRFVLRAQLVIRNMTEHEISVHALNGKVCPVRPMTVVAAGWQPSLERPESVSLLMNNGPSEDSQVQMRPRTPSLTAQMFKPLLGSSLAFSCRPRHALLSQS